MAIIQPAWRISTTAQLRDVVKLSRNYVFDCLCLEHPGTISIAEQFDLFNCQKILQAQWKSPPGWRLLLRLVGGTLWLRLQWQERLSVREAPSGAQLALSERVCGRSQNRLKRQLVCFGQKTHTNTRTHTYINERTHTCTHTPQRLRPKTNPRLWSLQAVPLPSPPEHPAQDPIFLPWPLFKLVFVVRCFECLFAKHDKQDMAASLKEKKKSFPVNSLSANCKVHVQTKRAN